jgi:transposase
MHIASIGTDPGKTTFHLVALEERNKILLRRKFSGSQLLAYTARTCLVLCSVWRPARDRTS